MNIEEELKQQVGTDNHFKTPDGYFDNLSNRVMSQLPEKRTRVIPISRWQSVKPWMYMAAMFAGAALMIQVGRGVFSTQTIGQADADLFALDTKELVLENIISDQDLDSSLDDSFMGDYSLYELVASE
ncbi:MAG: hypothetical protein WCR36_01210 [Bacteroidaceae bacterium]